MINNIFSNHSYFNYKHCNYVISGHKYGFTFIVQYTICKKYKITRTKFFIHVTPKSSILIIGDVRKALLKRILSKGISYGYTR